MALPSFSNLAAATHTFRDLGSTAQVIGSGGKTLYAVEVDNRNNTAETYLKLYNSASPTVGTTNPDHVEPIPAGVRRTIILNNAAGVAFGTALSAVCVTAAGTGGSTAPTADVAVKFWTN